MALPNETGLDGWLRYAPILDEEIKARFKGLHDGIVVLDSVGTNDPVSVAAHELQHGFLQMLGMKLETSSYRNEIGGRKIIVGTLSAYAQTTNQTLPLEASSLKDDGFWIGQPTDHAHLLILGKNARATLYGTYDYLMIIAQGHRLYLPPNGLAKSPSGTNRWVNQWDNMDGSIERGYGGKSIFFENGRIRRDLSRVSQYARLLSSVRLNGIIINNVNANCNILNAENLVDVARIADLMRPYGIRVGLALYFDSPRELGGLPTSDPVDLAVIDWWNKKAAEIHHYVPDLLGFQIKANSEGQPGPITYGRTLADGANLFARALKPHGDGVVIYRAFVYDHHLDESNWKNDRANAAVDYFKHLDDEFDDNVIIQIKFGPIDFQVREPPSPLFANLKKTNAVIELMVCQEYLGQQSHLVYQAPLWKTILDFDMCIDGKQSYVRDILSGERLNWHQSGYAAVVNVGNDPTWLGSHTAMANLFAYGRLAWNSREGPKALAEEWARLTFSLDERVVSTLTQMSLDSWPMYENYSGNLGIQTLCDIIGIHFGPSPGSQDGNGWGQWTRADAHAIGMDRTKATGSANTAQYPREVAARFESIESTPDELLLWFHHVPYTHKLKSGKTVIQHFYDAHYEGAAVAQTLTERWAALKGLIDDARWNDVALRLAYQAGHSLVWRDGVCEFYRAKCGIDDVHGRVRNHPHRIGVDTMQLDGYEVVAVTPAEMAFGGKAVVVSEGQEVGFATITLNAFETGTYDVAVNYFDHLGGKSSYEIFLGGEKVGQWKGDLKDKLGHDFSDKINGHSATRVVFAGIQVKKGVPLTIKGRADGKERAPLDYVSILSPGTTD